MPKKKKKVIRSAKKKIPNTPSVVTVFFIFLFVVFSVFNLGNVRSTAVQKLSQVLAARRGGENYDSMAGCASKTARPCYDKLTGSDVNILGKNGQNVFTSCTSNAAPNKVGEFIHKSSVCEHEKVVYCHDGKSDNYLRKFTGDCGGVVPPPPQPTLEPTVTQTPTTDIPFRIVYPNGGEQLPFGSEQVVRWEGGDTTGEWPIFLSIIDQDRYVAVREMVVQTPNDGQDPWIVDLPIGNYLVFYGQGCRFSTCASASQWDYSDARFSVVAGAPIEKINSTYVLNQSLVALIPSGGETWGVGTTQNIRWSGGTNDWKLNIYLIDSANSSTYTILANDTANDGVESWTVPAFIPPKQYKIYIGCTNCGSAPSGYTGGFYTYGFYPFTIQ